MVLMSDAPTFLTLDPGPVQSVVVLGGGAQGARLAWAAAHAGLATRFIEGDEGSRERAALFLSRQTGGVQGGTVIGASVQVCGPQDVPSRADIVFIATQEEDVLSARSVASVLGRSVVLSLLHDGEGRDLSTYGVRAEALVSSTFGPDQTLVELVPNPQTSAQTIATARAVLHRLGAGTVVLPADTPSVLAGLQDHTLAVLDRLLLLGGDPYDLDRAMEGAGFAKGLCAAQDALGLDRGYQRRRALGAARHLVQDRMVEEGRQGHAAGVGWYRYPGGGGAVEDPLLEDLIAEESYFAKISREEIAPADLYSRLVLAQMAEALRMLDLCPGVSPAQIDRLSAAGLGRPTGLLSLAQAMGARELAGELRQLESDASGFWSPVARLSKAALSGVPLI